jgi:V8-like Glu-specific endopeptidase
MHLLKFAALVLSLMMLDCDITHAAEAAIGRLNYAGYRQQLHCSATLIGPQMALTAAHCVTGRNVTDMHFLPGYDHGEWVEQARLAKAFIALPPRDVAIVCLQQPARTKPFAISAHPALIGERLVVIGYPIPAMHVQNRAICSVDTAEDSGGAFRLSCPMKPGASGSPVLRRVGDSFEVVGVISATSATQTFAFGVGPNAPSACN